LLITHDTLVGIEADYGFHLGINNIQFLEVHQTAPRLHDLIDGKLAVIHWGQLGIKDDLRFTLALDLAANLFTVQTGIAGNVTQIDDGCIRDISHASLNWGGCIRYGRVP
jgi:hypothetical protein